MGPAWTGVHSVARRGNDNDLSKKAKRNEEKRVQRKMDKTTPKETGTDPALDPTIDWNHSDDYMTQE